MLKSIFRMLSQMHRRMVEWLKLERQLPDNTKITKRINHMKAEWNTKIMNNINVIINLISHWFTKPLLAEINKDLVIEHTLLKPIYTKLMKI